MRNLKSRIKLLIAKSLWQTPFWPIARTNLNSLKAKRLRLHGIDLYRAKIAMRHGQFSEAREMLKEEVRLHANNEEAMALLKQLELKMVQPSEDSFPAGVADVLAEIRPYTMLSEKRLIALYTHSKKICVEDKIGNFAECGVAAGGSAALLAWVIARYSKRDRTVYAFDTFDGLPPPGVADTHAGKRADVLGWGEGTCAAPETSLNKIAQSLGVKQIIRPVRGLFSKTLPLHAKEVAPLALLHLDGDWYESTMDILNNLYDAVMPGGYLQIDDYGYWAGCRKAVEDFQKTRELSFAIEDIDGCGVCLVKPSL